MITGETFKITVRMSRRPDGGLRVWSDQLPGLVLSNKDPQRVMADIVPAMELILAEMLGCPVKAERLSPLPVLAPMSPPIPMAAKVAAMIAKANDFIERTRGRVEYAALACA